VDARLGGLIGPHEGECAVHRPLLLRDAAAFPTAVQANVKPDGIVKGRVTPRLRGPSCEYEQ